MVDPRPAAQGEVLAILELIHSEMNGMTSQDADAAPPRIERLKVRNFRALRDVEITRLTPMTVLLGPNGSGKSTVFDVFAFLRECLGLH